MEETKALLNEYAALCGCDDHESKARKDEILAWLDTHADDVARDTGRMMLESKLDKLENDIETIRTRVDEETYRLLPLSYIAKRYFGKSASWLSQRLNGTPVRGKRYTLNAEQKDLFNQAIKDISERLGSLHLD